MVSRYYSECLGGHKRIERLLLMGGPHKGAVKGLVSMLVAPEVLPFGIMGERLQADYSNLPHSYQILPDYPVGTDQKSNQLIFLETQAGWMKSIYPLFNWAKTSVMN